MSVSRATPDIAYLIAGGIPGEGLILDNFLYNRMDTVENLSCEGFEPPMDQGAVTVGNSQKRQVLPLLAQLKRSDGSVVANTDLSWPPVVQVTYTSTLIDAIDITPSALRLSYKTAGNQFVFQGDQWLFNLSVKDYTAPGTYTIEMRSGDETTYKFEPTCSGQFVRQ